MNLSRILVVARKELTDSFRDRRAIYTVLGSALASPILIAVMLNQMASDSRAAREIRIPIVGRANGPILVNWLAQQSGVEVVDGPADPEAGVRDRKQDFVLVIDKEFAEKFRDSRSAPVKLVSDSTRQSSQPKVRRLQALLTRFNGQMASLRLIAHGVSPAVASVLKVDEVEISNSQQRAATLLSIIPIFLITTAFTAGMQIATDATAGERERFSLEPLLINPVPRWQLIGGKWLASVVAALAAMAATLFITANVLARSPLQDLGIRYHLGAPEYLLLFAVAAPIGFIAPALQIYLSCFAKSFKEAQSYNAFLILAAISPPLLATFFPLGDKLWLKLIPITGQYTLAVDILGGKIPSPILLAASGLITLAVVAVFLWLAARLFASEKIIFGR